ncbi:hypothetical protein ACFS5M_05905 [Lacinutrix iliipiscaria]|uniref:DUF4412 domain-containing protein n=1 Tax=Lacinutrix iliipiscaria TaxID=1230532 RepID=A0ABW5WPW4_9FLAO
MKKILCILLLAFSFNTIAQEKLTEGVVTSKMTLSSTNPAAQSQFDMIGEILSTTYFKDNKTRSEVQSMMTGETTNIIDNDEKKMLVYMNNQAGKVYAESTFDSSEDDSKNVTITKGEETKTVMGYECTKYNVVVENEGTEVKMNIFATDKISAISQQTVTFGEEFKGFPMYMEIEMNQMGIDMTMTMEVTKIEPQTVSEDKFDMTPPEGYKKVESLQQGM